MSQHDDVLLYARCLYTKGDIVEWRALGRRVEQGWVLAEELAKQIESLARLNIEGLNIYVGANPRTEKRKTGDANVAVCRTLFVDFDHLNGAGEEGLSYHDIATARIEQAGLPVPTLLVFSGHGIHAYWRLMKSLNPDTWTQLQQRMIATLDTDRVIKNPERIMRLPGFDNCKEEPRVPCFVVDGDYARKYPVETLVEKLCELPVDCPPGRVITGPSPIRPFLEVKARAMLYAAKWSAIAEHDGRNNAAYLHACQLTNDFELSDADAWEILRQWNNVNRPPLTEDELRKAFDSGRKGAKNPPGCKLAERPKTKPVTESKAVVAPAPARVVGEMIEATIAGERRAVEWPWPELGGLTEALIDGTVTVICGPKGATKTFFVLQSMTHWLRQGEKVAMLVLEESIEHCLLRCLAQASTQASVTRSRWIREHPAETRAAYQDHKDFLEQVGSHLWDSPDDEMSLTEISDWIEARTKDRYRIIIVDPITATAQTREPWIHDTAFINHVKRIAREHGNSVVLTTHPKKGGSHDVDMDSLAGSAGYIRFAQTILWLEAHDDRDVMIRTPLGRMQESVNRTLHILAARNAHGRGKKLGYRFLDDSLTFEEAGVILKKE